ncbi:MAG: helix-turn-helix domain-containing protein [gamma proteobacterium symbiont of Taylorina sp.]|nr:helix-turn-helix domain-containing protein [gamma proteobacterium symbiont of Taylorina sp.]
MQSIEQQHRSKMHYKIIYSSKTSGKNTGVGQKELILDILNSGGSGLSLELRDIGITNPSARINELIAEGYNIETHYVTVIDLSGRIYRNIALYTLISSPDEEVVI